MDQFLEMLRSAQGGHGMEAIAQAYGLSVQQAQAVAEAMLPAFAEGFRQASQSPESMGYLMALMSGGPYASLYGQPVAAPAELSKAGGDALDAVFGSNDVSRAVANQVAASTGLGLALVRQMMPSYAALVVGGLARSLAASGALQQMLAAMLNRAVPPAARPLPASTGNPWIDAFMAFSGAGAAPRALSTGNPWADAFAQTMMRYASPPAASAAGNAWQDVVNAMANTMAQAGMPPGAAPARRAPEPPKPLPFQDYFTQMFTQGFPPSFPGTTPGGGRPPYSLPEYWLDMVTPSSKEPAAPKPVNQLKPPAAPKGSNGTSGK